MTAIAPATLVQLPEADDRSYWTFKIDSELPKWFAENEPPKWGFPIGGGNTLGELTFITKYSRIKPDGTKERWHDTCERVVNGMYSALKDHCHARRTPWDEEKAQESAVESFARLYRFQWTPPGRGLWMMGTKFVAEHGSAALQNCAFISTKNLHQELAAEPFVRLMEMCMLGIGVGFDVKGAGRVEFFEPNEDVIHHTVDDSREGWCDSTDLLISSYTTPNHPTVVFHYDGIRPAGAPIKGFGGIAAGPNPLISLHESIAKQLSGRKGQRITVTDIVDLNNKIGKCVASGNVRRSAEIALGDAHDQEFISLKDWEQHPERMGPDGWGNLSNNSVIAEVGGEYDHLAEYIAQGSEPGLIYMDLMRSHGRMVDPPNDRDWRVEGVNPCAEQSLEDRELCTLVETFPIASPDYEDFTRVLKHSYLYAKSVTLIPTHWPDSNEVMQRNRRIGTSVSGLVQFTESRGWSELKCWLDRGYKEVIKRDKQYSEWLGIRESVKSTSVKPSGTVPRLGGFTSGISYPVKSGKFKRVDRYGIHEPIVQLLRDAGYHIEPDVMDPENQVCISFAVRGHDVRDQHEVSVWEKMALGEMLQAYWADNSVSATYSFMPHEAQDIPALIRAFEGKLKAMAFMAIAPSGGKQYAQQPFQEVSPEEWEYMHSDPVRMDTEALYTLAQEAAGETGCANDVCLI